MDYGVGVSNRYAFLEQDVEDALIIETVNKKADNVKIADAKTPSKKIDKSASQGKGKQATSAAAGPVKKGTSFLAANSIYVSIIYYS